MRRHLPPFAAIRAFEAAARHQSFKSAAEELHLSQSAISHQVKALEEFLGVALFRRNGHGVELTSCGCDYVADVSCILDRLSTSTERLAGVAEAGTLKVCATPGFASRWLMPRMACLAAAHSDIEVEIATTTDPLRFPDDDSDVLIQYGREPADGFRVEPFMSSSRVAVCSPKLVNKGLWPQTPDDLSDVTLLRDLVGDDWAAWFALAKAKMPDDRSGPLFTHCELALRAAEEGQGVALGYTALIGREIADGRLVQLFNLETEPKVIYSLTCPEAWANHPRIAAFRNWLFAEMAKDDQSKYAM